MAYYDENGNLIDGNPSVPVLPNPAPREVSVEIKDADSDTKAKVTENGLQVEVTSMPAITIDTSGLEINVDVQNQVEITNGEGEPIPVTGTVQVSNTDPIEVSVSNFPDPVTEVSVSNFPDFPTSIEVSNFPDPITSIEVSNFPDFPATIEVSNQPTSIEVSNFPDPITSIEVSNFPDPITEIAINNFPDFPTSIEVSNLPDTQTISGTVLIDDATAVKVDVTNTSLTVEVSNLGDITPPSEITINNTAEQAIPVNGTVEVSNLLTADELAQAQKEWIEKRYTIYDDVPTFYADSVKPQPDPFGRDGMHFKNDHTKGISHLTQANFPTYTQAQLDTAKKKINWYFYDPAVQVPTSYANFRNAWALVTMDRTKTPFFYIYGSSNGTSITSAWVFSNHTTQIEPGKTYLIWFGTEEPTVFPEYQRIQLGYSAGSSYGTRNPNEIILSIAYTSNSVDAINTTEFQTYFLGFKTANANRFVKLGVKPQNTVTITNTSFEISNLDDITPPSDIKVNNTATEPIPVTGSINVDSLPAIEITNTSFEVSNTVTVTGDVNATVSGTVLIDSTTPVSVTVSNPVESVTVSNLSDIAPPTEIKINNTATEAVPVSLDPTTSINATVSGTVEVSNMVSDVTVSSLPAIEIAADQIVEIKNATDELGANIPVDVNITNELTITPPDNQNVTVVNETDINVNVSNLYTQLDPMSNLTLPLVVIKNQSDENVGDVPLLTSILNTGNPVDVNITNLPLEVTSYQGETVMSDVPYYENPENPGEYSYDANLGWPQAGSDYQTSQFFKSVKISNPINYSWPPGSNRAGWLANRSKNPEEFGAIISNVDPIHVYIDPNVQPTVNIAGDVNATITGQGTVSTNPLYITIVGAIDAGNWNNA